MLESIYIVTLLSRNHLMSHQKLQNKVLLKKEKKIIPKLEILSELK